MEKEKIKPPTKSILYKYEYHNIKSTDDLPDLSIDKIGNILKDIKMVLPILDYEKKQQDVNFRNVWEGTRQDLAFHYAHIVPIYSNYIDQQGFAKIEGYKIERIIKVDIISFLTKPKEGMVEHRIYQIGARYGADTMTLDDLYGLGELNYEAGNFDNSIKFYSQALKLDPKDPIILTNLGLAYGCKENYKKAIELYKKAIELDPSDAITWDNLGIAYEQEGLNQQAKECYQRALELDPNDDEIKTHLKDLK